MPIEAVVSAIVGQWRLVMGVSFNTGVDLQSARAARKALERGLSAAASDHDKLVAGTICGWELDRQRTLSHFEW